MAVIAAALIGGAISLGINAWNQSASSKASRISSAESANDAMRKRNEMLRQKSETSKLFNTEMSATFGNDFLSKLKGGADTASLIQSLSQGNTAFSKRLQEYEANAKQSIDNSVRDNMNAGVIANMHGQMNALNMTQMGIQAEQSQGAAIGSQVTSGVRSDRGTGANAQKMQEQANEMALASLAQQIDTENKSAMMKMESGQISASQMAANLRKEADITAEEAIERSVSAYAKYQSEQRDLKISADNYEKDYDYLKEKAGNESIRITEQSLSFEDD